MFDVRCLYEVSAPFLQHVDAVRPFQCPGKKFSLSSVHYAQGETNVYEMLHAPAEV